MRHPLLHPADKLRHTGIALRNRSEKALFLAGLCAPAALILAVVLAA